MQTFRLPTGVLAVGLVLTRPCSDPTCDHPLIVRWMGVHVTWPSSWRVSV